MNEEMLSLEFQRQIENLLKKDYPKAAKLTIEEFLELTSPLEKKLAKLDLPEADFEHGSLPFVIVVKSSLVATEKAMALVKRNEKEGLTKLFPLSPNDFKTIPEENIPSESVYLIIDIDRGKKVINKPPSEAMKQILKQKRLPLTIDEGVAVVTQYPDFLKKNNCFSLLASRHEGDQRVPAIWINAKQHPNLGWCWNGNPHTWLGSASCKERL